MRTVGLIEKEPKKTPKASAKTKTSGGGSNDKK